MHAIHLILRVELRLFLAAIAAVSLVVLTPMPAVPSTQCPVLIDVRPDMTFCPTAELDVSQVVWGRPLPQN